MFRFWQVDVFAENIYEGNPTAVFILYHHLEDSKMQKIAREMNLSETTFVILDENNNNIIRWFSPTCEIELCIHGTLGAAHVLFNEIKIKNKEIYFQTKSGINILGSIDKFKLSLEINFQKLNKITSNTYPHEFYQCLQYNYQIDTLEEPSSLGNKVDCYDNKIYIKYNGQRLPIKLYKANYLLIIYPNSRIIEELKPDYNRLSQYRETVIVSAKSNSKYFDYSSRVFAPHEAINEDPATGSSQIELAQYWSHELGKRKLICYQLSSRKGIIYTEVKEKSLVISGNTITVFEGLLRD